MNVTNLSAADLLIGNRVVPRTKATYTGKIRAIIKYYSEKLKKEFTVPVERDDILAFFGWLTNEKHKDKPPAMSSVTQFKSALKWYYMEMKHSMAPEINQDLDTLLKGYQRRVSDYKLEGKMPVFEGKYHLPFEGYELLAKLILQSERFDQLLFAWPFLILQWNLIARTSTVSSMMMEHIGWEGDALLISTPKHKGDQEGANCFSRHVYANPAAPHICPVLALAVLTFTHGLRHDPSSSSNAAPANFSVFDGPNNKARWSATLQRCIALVPPGDIGLLGGEKKQLGTHSVRKGAASYCTGMVNGPSPVQVYLRAGWSLGQVQDRYLFSGAGGDQLTGRVLSGLPFNQVTFASLHPHFTDEGKRLIDWGSVMPLHQRCPDIFKQALPHLLASLCYHEPWLRETLHADHPLFCTRLFTSGATATLRPHVVTGVTRCAVTGLQATGIPSHLVVANELTVVMQKTEQLQEAVLSRCDELPVKLTDVMMSKFVINGAIPVTMDDMKGMLSDVITQMRSELRDLSSGGAAAAVQPSLVSSSVDTRFQMWMWGGRMHMVPEGWKIPSSINVKDTWLLWHFGHVVGRIAPLRGLKKFDVVSSQHSLWSKTRRTMQAIAQVMVDLQLVSTLQAVLTLSVTDSSTFFDQAVVVWLERLKPGVTQHGARWMEMKASTMYHLMLKKRKRAEIEEAEDDEEESEEGGEQGDVAAAAMLSHFSVVPDREHERRVKTNGTAVISVRRRIQ